MSLKQEMPRKTQDPRWPSDEHEHEHGIMFGAVCLFVVCFVICYHLQQIGLNIIVEETIEVCSKDENSTSNPETLSSCRNETLKNYELDVISRRDLACDVSNCLLNGMFTFKPI